MFGGDWFQRFLVMLLGRGLGETSDSLYRSGIYSHSQQNSVLQVEFRWFSKAILNLEP